MGEQSLALLARPRVTTTIDLSNFCALARAVAPSVPYVSIPTPRPAWFFFSTRTRTNRSVRRCRCRRERATRALRSLRRTRRPIVRPLGRHWEFVIYVSAAPPCRLFRRPRLQAHALLPTAHLEMLLPRRRCLFSYAAAPAPIRASPSSFSRRTTCESRRRAFTFLDVFSKWWLLPPRCARATAARARRVITGVPTANHAVPP